MAAPGAAAPRLSAGRVPGSLTSARPSLPPAGDAGPGSALPPPFLSLPAAGERGGGGGLRAQPEVPGPGRPPRRHGALGSGAVAAAAEEALGSRRRLRALPRLLPHQHLQAGQCPPRSTLGRGAGGIETSQRNFCCSSAVAELLGYVAVRITP